MAEYGKLSNDALRVLAGLTGNERAFTQITIQPLDPDDPNCTDRPGPDNADGYREQSDLCAYLDTLDGRATNRYFYRVAYVDGAHNRSELSISSPPVWLPNVMPPRAPVVTKVQGGERQILIRWALSREADLKEYQVFRTDSVEKVRDLRLMTLVHTEPVPSGNRPVEVTWPDNSVPDLTRFYYRLVAVDNAGNTSEPSTPVVAQAYNQASPEPPTWMSAAWNVDGSAIVLQWTASDLSLQCIVLRRQLGAWLPVSPWLLVGSYSFVDLTADKTIENRYRLRVRNMAGNVTRNSVKLRSSPIFVPDGVHDVRTFRCVRVKGTKNAVR